MKNILVNHYWYSPINVRESHISEKIYNSFSRPVADQSCKQNPYIFSKGNINKDLEKVIFK